MTTKYDIVHTKTTPRAIKRAVLPSAAKKYLPSDRLRVNALRSAWYVTCLKCVCFFVVHVALLEIEERKRRKKKRNKKNKREKKNVMLEDEENKRKQEKQRLHKDSSEKDEILERPPLRTITPP